MSSERDSVVEIAQSRLRFGKGATAEVGFDLQRLGAGRVMLLTDPNLRESHPVHCAREGIEAAGVEILFYDRVRVEPNDRSFADAIAAARSFEPEAFVAVGGGSTIDTAKAANLYSCYPADFLRYVNRPIGEGAAVPGPLKPLIAIPTTAGTGSETTGVAIFDLESRKVKTGISHRFLKPTLGIIDPDNTRTMPPQVAASTGLDVLCHAIESYTAIDYRSRPKPVRPELRPTYQGCNPVSDIWSLTALELCAKYLPRAVADPSDYEAREQMILASAYAGIGFGSAGVHLPHAMSYPVAGMVRDYMPPGFDVDHPMVPHGMSVILNAPAIFRRTAVGCPERHLSAAGALGADVDGVGLDAAGELLAEILLAFMRRLEMPAGLAELGYRPKDVDSLVAGTLAQARLTGLAPVDVTESLLRSAFVEALEYKR